MLGRRLIAASTLLAALAIAPAAHAATTTAADAVDKPAAEASAQASADDDLYATRFGKTPAIAGMTAVGRALFFDPALSSSGKLSCASCHAPAHAYGPPNARAVQLGGRDLKLPGTRAVPSLRYLQTVPSFSEHYYDDDGDDSIDQGPTGGHTWDGRAQTVHAQARLPLFSKFEMDNDSPEAVVEKVRKAPYAAKLRETFGEHVLDDPTLAFKAILLSLEVFQQSPAEFYPYDSKFDAFLRKQTTLTPAELRGFVVFNDPARGNCAICHPSTIKGGAFPNFTDYGYIAVGVPRNRAIPANADASWYDLGVCGPERRDLMDRPKFCGLFRTPSLRNVALRRSFFHNGAMHSLDEVMHFYAERDASPQKWYPHGADGVNKFDDLPQAYWANVNTEPPFGAKPGDPPALTDAEIRDVIAFLGTLTDGYKP